MTAQAPGGPEQIVRVAWQPDEPGVGEVLIRHHAIGVNFIDIYHRTGRYRRPHPIMLGSEAAGVVETVGPQVTEFRRGDRVAYLDQGRGTYATHGIASVVHTVPLPDAISFETAAAALLKGCTVEMLVERCARVQAGQTALVHAAAGGVGSMLVQWLKAIDVSVMAHAGTAEKAAIARALGADEALHGPLEDVAARVRAWTAGHGVDHVFDGVGAASWPASLAAVAKRGLIVSYGNASGPVPPFTALDLSRAGSIFVTRPSLFDYVETAAEMRASAARLFDLIGRGAVSVQIGARLPLAAAADAHRALESRSTTGAIVLIP